MAETFKFTVTTNPSPLYYTRDSQNPSITTISIAATQDGDTSVELNGFQFTISLGPNGNDLTAENNDSKITPVSLEPDDSWSFERVAAGIYRATPTGVVPVVVDPGEVLTFQLQNVIVNEVAGSTVIKNLANIPDDPENSTSTLIKERSSLEIDNFSGYPASINPNQFTTLTWETTAASSVTLIPGNPLNLPTSGKYEVSPQVTTTYYLTASGEGPSITQAFPIQVFRVNSIYPSITSLIANPRNISPFSPSRITLSWNVINADQVSLSPGSFRVLELTDSIPVTPAAATTYTLIALNATTGFYDSKQLTLSPSNTVSEFYSQGSIAERMKFELICTNLPLNSAVSMWSDQQGTDPQIVVSKTTVNQYPSFSISITVDVPANFAAYINMEYFPEGQGTPSNGSMVLQVAPATSEEVEENPRSAIKKKKQEDC